MPHSVFPKPRSRAAKRFEKLATQRADLLGRARQARAEHDVAAREVTRLHEALVKAKASKEVESLLGPDAPSHEDPRGSSATWTKPVPCPTVSGPSRRRCSNRPRIASRASWRR